MYREACELDVKTIDPAMRKALGTIEYGEAYVVRISTGGALGTKRHWVQWSNQ